MYAVKKYGTTSYGTVGQLVPSFNAGGFVADILYGGAFDHTDILDKSYWKSILNRNPVGYWRLGEKSDVAAVDEVGLNDGTYVGDPVFDMTGAVDEDINTAIEFRYADYMRISNFAQPNTTQLSFVAWVMELRNDQYEDIFVLSDSTTGGIVHGFRPDSAGNFRFVVHDGNFRQISVPSTLNEWVHYVGTFDNGEIKLYKNGELVASDQVNSTLTSLNGIGIGARSNGDAGAEVRVDEAAFFDYALSADEVELIYRRKISGPEYIWIQSSGESDYTKDLSKGNFATLIDIDGLSIPEIPFSANGITSFGSDGAFIPEIGFDSNSIIYFDSSGLLIPEFEFDKNGFVTSILLDGSFDVIKNLYSSDFVTEILLNGDFVPTMFVYSGGYVYVIEWGGAAWWYLRDLLVTIHTPILTPGLEVDDLILARQISEPQWIGRLALGSMTMRRFIVTPPQWLNSRKIYIQSITTRNVIQIGDPELMYKILEVIRDRGTQKVGV